jgi:maltose O-acetyltransferase
VRIRKPGKVKIGAGSSLLGHVWIDSWESVTIGRNVLINDDVMLLTAGHDVDSPTFEGDASPITIGDYAWLPTRIVVLPGVSIGEAAVVGTGAVVAHDVEEYTVVAGNPAKLVSQRARQQYRYVPSQL